MKHNKNKQIIKKILNYCKDVELAHKHFQDDKILFFDKEAGIVYRNAIAMPILQIGELAKNFSADFLSKHNTIEWKGIIRTRDFFAHHYGNIDIEMVWDTSHADIEQLKNYLLEILPDFDNVL